MEPARGSQKFALPFAVPHDICKMSSGILVDDRTSRPHELRKRTLVLVLGQVVLTEPLRFRLGHAIDHSDAADASSSLRFEMRTATLSHVH